MPGNVAAIFAHPDDEILGCGGALARHSAGGDRVRILLLATGLAARGEVEAGALDTLRDKARRAADIIGAEAIEFADFADNAMDTAPLLKVVQRIEAFLDGFAAETIYTHHVGDLNVDHQITGRAVMTACRPLPGAPARAVLACEVSSSTEWSFPTQNNFEPTEFIDISSVLETKIEALACYDSELRAPPNPRSLEGVRTQARWRGHGVGIDAAEAFVTLRRLQRDER